MDLFEVSVIDDTHTPCYNGCSPEYGADMVDDYEIKSTGNDTVVGAESANATEGTAADTPEERGSSLELMRLELELMEMEARYKDKVYDAKYPTDTKKFIAVYDDTDEWYAFPISWFKILPDTTKEKSE